VAIWRAARVPVDESMSSSPSPSATFAISGSKFISNHAVANRNHRPWNAYAYA
jgi:hypothetical protein